MNPAPDPQTQLNQDQSRLALGSVGGLVPCWYGSGSADPCLSLMDPDPDPAIFVTDLQDANKKLFFSKFFCSLLFEGTFTSFFKDN